MRSLLAAAAFLSATAASAQPWPTTDWTVGCTRETALALGTEDARFNCVSGGDTGAATLAEYELEEASPWLRDLGFRAPRVSRQPDGTYRAWISDEVPDLHLWGGYVASIREIFLRSNYWIHQDYGDLDTYMLRPSNRTMIHELFHGVQHAYQDENALSRPELKWVIEGTAEAVEYAWFSKTDPSAPPLHLSTAQGLDQPLAYPCGPGACDEAYRRYYFWNRLGALLDSPDRVQYLDRVLQQDLSGNGLAGVHAALTEWDDEGLYHYYPEFVARYGRPLDLYTPDGYGVATLEAPAEGAGPVEASFDNDLAPVATHAYDFALVVPEGETVGVEIEAIGDADWLHLVVDGVRYDRGDYETRNRFRTTRRGAGEPDTLHVRVANVAPNPAATDTTAYTLLVTLSPAPPPCSEAGLVAAMNGGSPGMGPLLAQAAAVRQSLVADDENGVFDLGVGDLAVNGDGGVACVTHFGMSDVEWSTAPGDAVATRDELVTRHLPRVAEETGVSEADLRLMLQGQVPPGLDPSKMMLVMQTIQRLMSEPLAPPEASGVYVYVFAPNLVGALGSAVAPDELGTPESPLTRHDGVGGWSANAAAGVTIYLPGTAPADVEAGQSYPAVAFARAPEDDSTAEGPETRVAFYTRWQGDWEPYECESGERESFEGSRHTLWGRLDGTVTFTAVSPTRVEGTFQLSGPGIRETVTHTLDAQPSGCLRHETDRALEAYAVTVSGSFVAPNVRSVAPFSVGGVGQAVPMGAR